MSIRLPETAELCSIASCLVSIDTPITEQTMRVNTLNAHKQGLKQGLSPDGDSA